MLVLTLLNLDISCLENIVDPEKPADQDLTCFQLYLSIHFNKWNLANYLIKIIGKECRRFNMIRLDVTVAESAHSSDL